MDQEIIKVAITDIAKAPPDGIAIAGVIVTFSAVCVALSLPFIIIPYAMSDYSSGFASVSMDEIFDELEAP